MTARIQLTCDTPGCGRVQVFETTLIYDAVSYDAKNWFEDEVSGHCCPVCVAEADVLRAKAKAADLAANWALMEST